MEKHKQSSNNKMNQQWSKIIAKCWNDEDYKQRFLKNPKEALKAEGINVPNDVNFKVYENSDQEIHLILPQKKNEALSEEELKSLAGGWNTSCACRE